MYGKEVIMTRIENFIFNIFLDEKIALNLKNLNIGMFNDSKLVKKMQETIAVKEKKYERDGIYDIDNFLEDITYEWLKLSKSMEQKEEKNMLNLYFYSYYYNLVLKYINVSFNKSESYITKKDLSWFIYLKEQYQLTT